MTKAILDNAPVAAQEEVLEAMTGVAERPTSMNYDVATRADTADLAVNIRPPTLQIAHGVGNLAKTGNFIPGSLVLGGDVLVVKPREPVGLVVWKFRPYFKEYLSKDQATAGVRPREFDNAEQAHAAGLTTTFDPVTHAPPQVAKAMEWRALVEKPDGLACEQYFCIDAAGRKWAPVTMFIDKGTYRNIEQKFFFAVLYTAAKRGIHTARWALSTTMIAPKNGSPAYWGLQVSPMPPLSDPQVEEFKAALQPNS